MKVYGNLVEAGWELLSEDPIEVFAGRTYLNYTTGNLRVYNAVEGVWKNVLLTDYDFPVPDVANTNNYLASDGSSLVLTNEKPDYPPYLAGDARKVLKVNQSETGVEWTEQFTDLAGNAGKALAVKDTEDGVEWKNYYPDYTGNAGKALVVNVTEDDVEWSDQIDGYIAYVFTAKTAVTKGNIYGLDETGIVAAYADCTPFLALQNVAIDEVGKFSPLVGMSPPVFTGLTANLRYYFNTDYSLTTSYKEHFAGFAYSSNQMIWRELAQ